MSHITSASAASMSIYLSVLCHAASVLVVVVLLVFSSEVLDIEAKVLNSAEIEASTRWKGDVRQTESSIASERSPSKR